MLSDGFGNHLITTLFPQAIIFLFCEGYGLKHDCKLERKEKQREMMGGHGGDGHQTTYKGFTMHHPKRWHALTGKGMCAIMWCWVLYRAKQDGPVVLGWRHPWEGHVGHSHGHGHEHEA